ncbi:PIN domain-containing protein [Salinigranum halophilum]|uniref:PIN domain-containing protein n=1 Tax=Salinigranum halophilum TaxID=2565931 RepID=UPI001375ED4D|nr:PIN domain-containing protein [Salinigranum halophilum]
MKLVDSSFLIDYAIGDEDALTYLAAHDAEEIGASTIVCSELYRGLMITQEMTQEEAMSKYEWVEPVAFTNTTAAGAAAIRTELRSKGELINRSDLYIAGTARSLGVPLVAGDDYFHAIEGLDLETYRESRG